MYMKSDQRQRRQLHAARLVRARHRSRYQRTVNVNNRVQIALSQLPHRGAAARASRCKKKSSAILQFHGAFQSPTASKIRSFITNYATINMLDPIKSTPGVGQAPLLGPQDYAMRDLVQDTQRLTSLNLTPADVIAAIQAQNVQAPVGRIGARPISRRPAVPAQHPDPGTARHRRAVRQHRAARQPGWFGAAASSDVARVEIGAQNLDRETRIDGQPPR